MPPITTKDLWEASKTQAPLEAASGETHPADDGYAPPVTTVRLPSRGLVYPMESPLYRLESVDIKAVTAKEENILSSPVLIKKGIVLTTLMRACITNKQIDPEQMLVGDRNAILTAIRISAYGPAYSARVQCPVCEESNDNEFNLGRLGLKMLDVEPTGGAGSNEFAFKLPVSGRVARFKLMDASAVAALERDVEEIRKKTGQEQSVTMRLQAQVTALEGIDDPKKLGLALTNLAARDSRALRLYMDQIAPGVDMAQKFECDSCGKSSEVEIPIGTEFFWPTEG